MNRKYLSWFAVLLATTIFNGCVVGYRNYPRQQLTAPYPNKQYAHLYYHVEGSSLSGGYLALRNGLRLHSPFQTTEDREEIPNEGVYIKAKVTGISPSMSALVFGYVSYTTLTLLPFWSAKDGSLIRFDVYKNKELVKSFDYEVRRFGAVWAGLLPFIWANLITASEEQAFDAITKQFFEDGNKYFN